LASSNYQFVSGRSINLFDLISIRNKFSAHLQVVGIGKNFLRLNDVEELEFFVCLLDSFGDVELLEVNMSKIFYRFSVFLSIHHSIYIYQSICDSINTWGLNSTKKITVGNLGSY
jgi:hypothetical protein